MKAISSKRIFRFLTPPWKIIKNLNFLRYKLINKTIFRVFGIKYINFPTIKGIIFIRNQGGIKFGEGVSINSGLSHNAIGGSNKTVLYTTSTGNIIIGNNVGISNACLFSACNITIENDVLIGAGVQIYDTDFHSLIFENRILLKHDPDIRKLPVFIGRGAFIGANVIILKGVTVGTRSVIGAGSVVSRNIPANEVWAGNPAAFIKSVPVKSPEF